VDVRSAYAAVLENWLGAYSQEILGGTFERLGLLR
jgi:hypothetical protein